MNITLPETIAAVIAQVETRFDGHVPPYQNFVHGLLFATGEHAPLAVRVPVIGSDGAQGLDSLQYMAWMAPHASHPATNLSSLDLEIGDGHSIDVAFTVFIADQVNPMGSAQIFHPVNRYVQSVNAADSVLWRGNILVMRREAGTQKFMDMRPSDHGHARSCVLGHDRAVNAAGVDMLIVQ
ncbi:hypothetical protein B0H13DRAFT_1901963 [Mycena leptocephala]|nr:hypothetical protein B0H13DRAFT_1901963 [Mycena leptocephala]